MPVTPPPIRSLASRHASQRSLARTAQRNGAHWVLVALPGLLAGVAFGFPKLVAMPRTLLSCGAATLLLALHAAAVHRPAPLRRTLGLLGVGLTLFVLAPHLLVSPAAALAAIAAVLLLMYLDLHVRFGGPPGPDDLRYVAARRAQGAAALALPIVALALTIHGDADPLAKAGITLAAALPMLLSVVTLLRTREVSARSALLVLLALLGALAMALGYEHEPAWAPACLAWLLCGFLVEARGSARLSTDSVWETLLLHPARFLVTTFLLLVIVGTVLMSMPWVVSGGEPLTLVEAAFTSVSGVCVTGLSVVDVSARMSTSGQVALLVLIQLGGLGIMSISTLLLQALGRRLSLRHERMLVRMGDPSGAGVFQTLRFVVLFTLLTELVGAVGLTALFAGMGESFGAALHRGVFTSISAFCNAGFSLQTNSLIPYQDAPAVLHLVGILIILGGLSPAVVLSMAARARGRRMPPVARLVLWLTVILLGLSTLAYGVFEWSGSLGDLSWGDRVHNAWFQGVTLRTAGFNSVDIAATEPETHMLMHVMMFIGGSPGGTAGGVKTTTIAVLVLAVWAVITGRRRAIVLGYVVPAPTVFRAVAVVVAGIGIWAIVLVFLLLTQEAPPQDLVFETTSALGTVGLSTGATAALDGVGRVIVMCAMFLGRIGPLTLFMLLSEAKPRRTGGRPQLTVPIA